VATAPAAQAVSMPYPRARPCAFARRALNCAPARRARAPARRDREPALLPFRPLFSHASPSGADGGSYWQVELWQEFFALIHLPTDQPRPTLAPIREALEAHLAQPAVAAELRMALARQRVVLESRASASRLQANRRIQADTLRRALGAVAADLGTQPPVDDAAEWVVPLELVHEALLEIFGSCPEPELVQVLNKAVNTGKLANARGGFVLAPLI